MIALRKLGVFLPQLIGLGAAAFGGSAIRFVGLGSFWTIPLAALVAGTAVASLITTFTKIDAIDDHGWGRFRPQLEGNCASCRGYRMNNERLKRELEATRDALKTLRLPS